MTLTSFAWVHKHSLAGSGRPGLLRELEEDLEFIRESGFRMIVTLTQRALPEECDVEGIEPLQPQRLGDPRRDVGVQQQAWRHQAETTSSRASHAA